MIVINTLDCIDVYNFTDPVQHVLFAKVAMK